MTMAGPLMTSAVALFGDNSLFAAANSSTDTTTPSVLAQICQDGRLPFTAFNKYRDYTAICESQESDDEKLLGIMKTFVDLLFSERADAVRYLSASVYVLLYTHILVFYSQEPVSKLFQHLRSTC